ncbi:MAG: beta family protein [Bacteroidetes bacterium]|nr:beta family protein [Bacteroidota bacterium]
MKYFPILLSKAGEFKALKELSQLVKSEVAPIIEVIPNSIDRVNAQLSAEWSFANNQVLLDFSAYNIGAGNIAGVQQLFASLRASGVNAVPVIQQNSSASYIQLVANLVAQNNATICIRASNTGGGLINFYAGAAALMAQVGSNNAATMLLIDLGYAEIHNYNNLSALAIMALNTIPNQNQWASIIVAAGSFPVDLTHVNPPNVVHRLRRYEWDIWNVINNNAALAGVTKYSDYGNKNPVYGGEVQFSGSCSIKYTAQSDFVIYRGIKAEDHIEGNGQYIIFASRLILTPEYSGTNFSWGDAQINRIANEPLSSSGLRSRPGSATTWVEITQNHHITLLHSLL